MKSSFKVLFFLLKKSTNKISALAGIFRYTSIRQFLREKVLKEFLICSGTSPACS